jgi:hypothetical protein
MPDGEPKTRDELVAAYKTLLQTYIDRRPSGTRLKIANALGKHKSFVSQITNPAYAVPVPARHLSTIFAICHFSKEERDSFLAAYTQAHPNQESQEIRSRPESGGPYHTLHIEVPLFEDQALQHEVEDLIRSFAQRIIRLAGRE